ncbi:hypothetical protein HYDPIDRAFT_25743 [Hydnomerulius pinastri MD-312]|nr:hypothetical protein HYDPIDRAFT_25743 [Hydnomerulius pinastri MD-312]
MFIPSSLSLETRSAFIAQTFNDVLVEGCGGKSKKFFLLEQEELKKTGDLFPSCMLLDDLITELAEIFKYRYVAYDSNEALLVEHWSKVTDMQEFIQQTKTVRQSTALDQLKDHDWVLNIYAKYLAKMTWPTGGTAEPQAVKSLNAFGKRVTTHFFSKSTHTLEGPEMKKAKKSRVEMPGSSDSESDGGYATDHTEIANHLMEMGGSSATIASAHRSVSPLMPLPSSDRLLSENYESHP